MANTNPQAVFFANSKIRPLADHLYSSYLAAKSVVQHTTLPTSLTSRQTQPTYPIPRQTT